MVAHLYFKVCIRKCNLTFDRKYIVKCVTFENIYQNISFIATTIHHLILIFVLLPIFIFLRNSGVGDFFFGIAFIMEASTPFLAVRY